MSYVNEMEDCAGEYRKDGQIADPFELFSDAGMNLVRLRLWHNPDWTSYSNLEDVKKSIKRAKNINSEILLDLHYSDDWADPGRQLIPSAWADIASLETLGDSVYDYTFSILKVLYEEELLPEMVQIGNETNIELMVSQEGGSMDSINWERNIYLFNKGIKAVTDFEKEYDVSIETMIHIAQPENALQWFPAAISNGLNAFDWIGLSYYPKWSEYSLDQVPAAVESLIKQFDKRLMIVETAYPSTLVNADSASNLLGQDALVGGFPATPKGQKDYMISLVNKVLIAGGEGVIYWEPAWISNDCFTRWGHGSHWDNSTFFDSQNKNEVLEAVEFFESKNYDL
jgi:arabinogalactan endo-1,4-beta-galactosidase